MRSLSPRRRRAAVLAASTSSISAALLPVQKHLAHEHATAFGVAYVAVIVTMIAFSLRELIKARREEGCGQA
jgi:hypothetical protein